MKSFIAKYGQLLIILALAGVIAYSFSSNERKIDVGVLNSSIYADEKLNLSIETLKESNDVVYENIMGNEATDEKQKQDLQTIHLLTDSICSQINDLKQLAIDMSGGMGEEGNYYTINNLAYNLGHKNKLTGEKGKDNGEGSKLKLNLEKLRTIEMQLLEKETDREFVKRYLDTSERQENNSDYVFSWEEQQFKLLPIVGVINLLSVIENNVLNAERVVLTSMCTN